MLIENVLAEELLSLELLRAVLALPTVLLLVFWHFEHLLSDQLLVVRLLPEVLGSFFGVHLGSLDRTGEPILLGAFMGNPKVQETVFVD